VCNAAGCLILNSGETAYVADANSQPVMTDKKAEIPPPPGQAGQLPGFTAGNNTNSDGTPAGLMVGLTTGPGYSIVGAGYLDGYEGFISDQGHFNGHWEQTHATFDGNGLAVFTAYDGAEGFTRGATVGMLTDGVIGWGRWVNATGDFGWGSENWQHLHYVVGMPTPLADMSALLIGNVTATYNLTGFTYPTAYDGSTWHFGTQPISGSLTANFGTSSVTGNLTVPFLANTYTSNWSATIWPSTSAFNDILISNTATSTGSDCTSGCSAYIDGFFAGANASRAGLVYTFTGTDYGAIQGAAVFRR